MTEVQQKTAQIWKNAFINNLLTIVAVENPLNYKKFKEMLPRKVINCGYDIFRVAELGGEE